MKAVPFFLSLLLVACTGPDNGTTSNNPTDNDTTAPPASPLPPPDTTTATIDSVKQAGYANQRFRNVRVEPLEGGRYRITGQGQIFEARFGWVVEDGHNELAQGYESTDVGAPEWGNFSFIVKAKKVQPNSTLHLVLFETSANDGSRQHQLPVVLP